MYKAIVSSGSLKSKSYTTKTIINPAFGKAEYLNKIT